MKTVQEKHTCGQCNTPSLCAYCIDGILDAEGLKELEKLQKRWKPAMAETSCRS